MRRLARVLCLFTAFMLLLAGVPLSVPAAEAPPDVGAGAYALIDAQSGQVLVSKNAHTALHPASITKILTLGLVLENGCNAADPVTVSYRACHELIYGATHIALTEGEVVSVQDLLYGTQIESANDGANALAEYQAGSIEGFAEVMNAKMAELGLVDSHFSNPSGQPADDHLTSAYDMAQMSRWALTVPGFREIFQSTRYQMQPTNNRASAVDFNNRNPIMNPDSPLYYPGITGSKMGFTNEARYTMVTSARRGDTELICVVMACQEDSDKYASTTALLDYGFDNFARYDLSAGEMQRFTVPVYGGGSDRLGEIDVEGGADASYLLHKSISPEAVVAEYSVPEEYVAGQPFAPGLSLHLEDGQGLQETQLASVPMVWTGLDEIFAENTSAWHQAIVRYPAQAWFVALALALVGLLVLVRALVLRHRREKRRRNRRAAALATMPVRIAERPPARRSEPQRAAARRRPRPSFEVYDRRTADGPRRVGRAR